MHKKFLILFLLLFSAGVVAAEKPGGALKMEELKKFASKIKWYGQFTLHIPAEKGGIWVDPVYLPEGKTFEAAQIILLTHPHKDHFSPAQIKKLVKSGHTTVLAPEDCEKELQKIIGVSSLEIVEPLFFWKINGDHQKYSIFTLPAYNTVKKDKHPKEKKWLGYLLRIHDGRNTGEPVTIYIAGDTERVPEMEKIIKENFPGCIAIVPLGQKYTMNSVEEAVNYVEAMGAAIGIPVHYGMYEGTEEDADKFCELLKNKGIASLKIPRIKNNNPGKK